MRSDVIVIGAGIVGVSTALSLQQAGRNVILLDKKEPGSETSYGNSGNIESSYVLPFSPPDFTEIPRILIGRNTTSRLNFPSGLTAIPWILDFYRESKKPRRIRNGKNLRPLIKDSIRDHKALMKGTVAEKYLFDTGRAKIHRSAKSFQKSYLEIEMAKELGIPYKIFDMPEFIEQESDLQPNFFNAVVWLESARLYNPGKVIKIYAKKFVENGGVIYVEMVTALSLKADIWTVDTLSNKYSATDVVICAGPWSSNLLKQLNISLPITIKRGYHQHFNSSASLKYNITDADYGYVISDMEQGIRITTGAEFSSIDAAPNSVQLEQVIPYARELIDLGDVTSKAPPWVGGRPCFADSCPAIGTLEKYPGLWVNIGHGHSGLTIGPSSGKLLAEMMTGQNTFCDPTPYSPTRF